MKIAIIVRIVLTAALLTQVWLNAHWSVALTLTLHAMTNELGEARRRREDARERLFGMLGL